jgi:hypothetical protein
VELSPGDGEVVTFSVERGRVTVVEWKGVTFRRVNE